jgi:hypothetical protein
VRIGAFNRCDSFGVLLGPSASSSSSSSNPVSVQSSLQGASGSNSPTTAFTQTGGTYNDPELQLATVQALASTVQEALSAAGAAVGTTLGTVNQLATQGNASSNSTDQQLEDVLGSALSAEQNLAAAQGTGGASLQLSQNKWLIAAGAAVALALVYLFARRH